MFLRIAEYAVTIVAPEQYSAGLVFCIFKMPNAFFRKQCYKNFLRLQAPQRHTTDTQAAVCRFFYA